MLYPLGITACRYVLSSHLVNNVHGFVTLRILVVAGAMVTVSKVTGVEIVEGEIDALPWKSVYD